MTSVMFFFQGHPEYDGISLMKEYKREVGRFVTGERSDYPPYPEHYFDRAAISKLEDHKQRVIAARSDKIEPAAFPEAEVAQGRDSTWTKAGQSIYANWLAEIERRVRRDSKK